MIILAVGSCGSAASPPRPSLVAATGYPFIWPAPPSSSSPRLTRGRPSWWGVVGPDDQDPQLAERLDRPPPPSQTRAPNKSRDPPVPGPSASTPPITPGSAPASPVAARRTSASWPEQVQELRVRFDDGRIYVNARRSDGGARSSPPRLRPASRPTVRLWLPPAHRTRPLAFRHLGPPTRARRFAASTSRPLSIASWVSEEIAELRRRGGSSTLAGANAVLSNPIVKLPDGRRVRLGPALGRRPAHHLPDHRPRRRRADDRSPAEPSPASVFIPRVCVPDVPR